MTEHDKGLGIAKKLDEFVCTVAGCALGADACHWMFKTKSIWFRVNTDNIRPDSWNNCRNAG